MSTVAECTCGHDVTHHTVWEADRKGRWMLRLGIAWPCRRRRCICPNFERAEEAA